MEQIEQQRKIQIRIRTVELHTLNDDTIARSSSLHGVGRPVCQRPKSRQVFRAWMEEDLTGR
jgi:hypothetical protein